MAILQWLSFVPNVAGNDPPTMLTADSVERDIAYVPEKGADPRLMLTGKFIQSDRSPADAKTGNTSVKVCVLASLLARLLALLKHMY
jgi:hypothetical protein